ncbi:hypothetical protein IGI04_001602 [Brassica rapa subsp. trilocularis]|uniref:Cyclin N-terminal domain-containing protein n=1 Tax=Brassica rapa subsp. trilocularis TaxID=1813537 RepID=A0ABQ7NT46_BRACM|nr:hypothetical protein IGI04_001602 [Brassica rapa subsp. trilocularis]
MEASRTFESKMRCLIHRDVGKNQLYIFVMRKTIGCKGNHLRQRFMVSFQTSAFWLLFVVLAFLVGKQLKVAQESLQKLKEFDIRMNHISIAAAVIYITTQLSDEKKPLRDLDLHLCRIKPVDGKTVTKTMSL